MYESIRLIGVIIRKLEVLPMLWRLLPSACALLLACSCSHGALRSDASGAENATPAATGRWAAPNVSSSNKSRSFPLIHVAADTQRCDQLQIACFQRCWERYPPYPVERGNKGQYRYCTSQCLKEYMECVKNAEAQPREFPNKAVALDWLEKHKTEILVGTLIFVGGAVFIIGTSGAGVLILIPVVAL